MTEVKRRSLIFAMICFVITLSFCFVALSSQAALAAGKTSSVTADPLPEAPTVVEGTASKGYTILMYHHLAPASVCVEGAPYYGNNAIISIENFEAQMAALSEKGYKTLLMSELYDYLSQGQMPPEGSVVITFDDGYASNYAYAFPILKKYGLKANIAVVVRSTEIEPPMPEGATYPAIGLPHLTFDQMREMQASGLIEFGSHTYDGHGDVVINAAGDVAPALVNKEYNPETGTLETDWEFKLRVTNELTMSKSALERQLGVPITYFAYPYGRYSDMLQNLLTQNGYHIAVTTRSAQATAQDKALLLPRINVPNTMTVNEFLRVVSGN